MHRRRSRTVGESSKGILAIDPGSRGGVCWLAGDVVELSKMPRTEVDVRDLIETYRDRTDFAIIEKVASMPRDGGKAAFTFGGAYKAIRMAVLCQRLRLEEVMPLKWQTEFVVPVKGRSKLPANEQGRLKREHKRKLKEVAQRLFPGVSVTLETADALLIAEWARRQNR